MLPQLKIHVDGSGSVFRTAERGVLHIQVSKSSKSQPESSDAVRETSAHLTTKFRTHARKTEGVDGRPAPHPDAGITAFTASSMSTHSQPEYEWVGTNNQRRDLGLTYHASSTFEVVFRDMALLADTAGQLAAMPNVAITSTEWRLTTATCAAIEREARKKAIENAVQKADDYAGVVGRKVVAVDITDGPASAASSISNPWRRSPFNGGGGGIVRQLQRNDAAAGATAATAAADAPGPGTSAGANGATSGRGACKRGAVGRAENHHGLGHGKRQVYLGGRGAGQHVMMV
ncbi:hypothetical protein PG984_001358 [Apiospora sp. TS-2023a]